MQCINTEETCSAHTKTKPGDNTKYGEYQKIQIIENDVLLKVEWTSTKLNVGCKILTGCIY